MRTKFLCTIKISKILERQNFEYFFIRHFMANRHSFLYFWRLNFKIRVGLLIMLRKTNRVA